MKSLEESCTKQFMGAWGHITSRLYKGISENLEALRWTPDDERLWAFMADVVEEQRYFAIRPWPETELSQKLKDYQKDLQTLEDAIVARNTEAVRTAALKAYDTAAKAVLSDYCSCMNKSK